jgi:hypothetical protein
VGAGPEPTAPNLNIAIRDSHVLCRLSSGSGLSNVSSVVVVSAGRQAAQLSRAVSYDVGVLVFSVVNGSDAAGLQLLRHLPSTGGVVVGVVGGGYGLSGLSASLRVGGSGCRQSTWASDSHVLCRLGWGTSVGLGVVVSAGRLAGSASEALSYASVEVSGVSGRRNGATSGAVSVTIVGSGMGGGVDRSAGARVGGSACSGSLWMSDSGVVCRVSAGSGLSSGSSVVVVSAGRQAGQLSRAVSYDAGVLVFGAVNGSEAAGLRLVRHLPSSGAVVVGVVGGGYGLSGLSASVRVGGSGCRESTPPWYNRGRRYSSE